jgi:Putative prokaryotic signal transducing protein
MKHVFSSPDSAQVALVQSLLDAVDIPCELRNEAVSQAEAGMPFITELWVLRDEDYEEARRLIRSEASEFAKPE